MLTVDKIKDIPELKMRMVLIQKLK